MGVEEGGMRKVGQNYLYTVYTRYFWHPQIYSHIWCVYTVLANPRYMQLRGEGVTEGVRRDRKNLKGHKAISATINTTGRG